MSGGSSIGWLKGTLAAAVIGFVATQLFLPLSDGFKFLQYPACWVRSVTTSALEQKSLSSATKDLNSNTSLDRRIQTLLDERDNIRAYIERLRNDRRTLVGMLDSERQRCAERDNCDPNKITADTVRDSFFLPGPRSLNIFDKYLDEGRIDFERVVRQRRALEASRVDYSDALKRFKRFLDMPNVCFEILSNKDIDRAALLFRGVSD
jgi:hypothetical protein